MVCSCLNPIIIATANGFIESEEAKLRNEQVKVERKVRSAKKDLTAAEKSEDADDIKRAKREVAECEKELKIVTSRLELCKAKSAGDEKQTVIHENELHDLVGHQQLSSPSFTGSTGVSQSKDPKPGVIRRIFSNPKAK
jgi:hypothetical protein